VESIKNLVRKNKSLLLFILLLATFRGAIADWHPVPTGSMKPTILEGDVVWHNKLAYDLKFPFTNIRLLELNDPKRGDIVVVKSSTARKRLIKRLIGLPGDEISIINNQLTVNGVSAQYEIFSTDALDHIRLSDRDPGTYAIERIDGIPSHAVHARKVNVSITPSYRAIVPDGHYFLMGDSRDNSADSRFYGSFPRKELRGRATRILLSVNILDAYKPDGWIDGWIEIDRRPGPVNTIAPNAI